VVKRTIEQKGFRPKTWTFEWNAQDQLIKAHCPDGAVWEYEYDPFGRRIAKKTKAAPASPPPEIDPKRIGLTANAPWTVLAT
jgi:YD repeat-containing protein